MKVGRKFLVVCEGDTEKAYFTYIGKASRPSSVVIKAVQDTSDPGKIIDLAELYVRGDAQRGIVAGTYDEVWAVFDWDRRPKMNEVLAKVGRLNKELSKSGGHHSGSRKVEVALSIPHFEVWIL